MSHGQNVTVDVPIGSKCHSGRSELGRNVQAPIVPLSSIFGCSEPSGHGQGNQKDFECIVSKEEIWLFSMNTKKFV